MRFPRLPDQVVRLGVLVLVALPATLLVRQRFVPASFGELGHYRAEAVAAAAARPLRYAGAAACAECHGEEAERKGASYHRALACEVCHGPAADHAADPGAATPAVPRERGAACLYCHEYLPSRPTGFPQIIERLHNPMRACIGCHDPHDPTPPHVPESCAACHAQIARTKSVSHHAALACETCHETPAEHLRQPRSHQPKKPLTREFCGRCHAPAATGPPEAPRVDLATHGERYVCWQCHYPHHPES
jgi:hypothetical protein